MNQLHFGQVFRCLGHLLDQIQDFVTVPFQLRNQFLHCGITKLHDDIECLNILEFELEFVHGQDLLALWNSLMSSKLLYNWTM